MIHKKNIYKLNSSKIRMKKGIDKITISKKREGDKE